MNANPTFYDKWRKMLIKHCLIIACIVFISEIIISVFYYIAGLFVLPLPLVISCYIILPSIINFTAVAAGRHIILSAKYNENIKNYAAILVLCILCACVQCVHYRFPAVMCVFCVPIFLSILFQSKALVRLVHILSSFFIILSGVIANFGTRKDDPYLIFDCVVAAIVVACSYIVSKILIQYEKHRTEYVKFCYTKQMELSEQLKYDLLTGLYNYNAFFEILKLKRSSTCSRLQLVVIDLDDFKYINDTYGHIQGNEVLIYISYLLKKYTSNIGYPARYGGEEFVVLFQDISIDEAFNIMEKVRKEFSEHYFEFSQGCKFTFSCGLAENNGELTSPQELFDNADRAMYLAKRSGKNKTVIAPKKYSMSVNKAL
ncbi:GGDEF domain-containing protein [Ruminiclostridium herbifermentans]|uniref:GGDEF domain-containing protein n=1 Tax=Ruminiclostridium herbifermentans TaxID=2488810 RepID=A0A7H1VTA6_9FIRM|nr:GGDEF domain-containing protein [Ruminiclostridium herbifermentans]QNU68618.1 GGDEF domain-containing protein [Ruminiclostridium herbifermentans]